MRHPGAVRHVIVYALLRGAVGLLGALPEPVMRRLGRTGGLIWHSLDGSRRRLARRHMERLGRPPDARELFASYGRYWAETFWVRPRRFAELREAMTVEGLEHLEKAKASGRGIVLLLPHLGNWEVAALIALDIQLPLVAVAERLDNPYITRWFTQQRSMFGIDVVLTGTGNVSSRLRSDLKQGKAVALLADRDLTGKGTTVEFFGEVTTLPAGPVLLSRRTGAVLLSVGIYFKPGRGHRAVIQPPVEFEASISVQEATRVLAERMEQLILRDPGQWHLVQPNWPSDRPNR